MSGETFDKAGAAESTINISDTMAGDLLESDDLKRDLKPRHVAMFSIACAIGTGLIIGSGTALSRGGPASVLIAYILIGLVVYFVMTALGEMASFLPSKKGFSGYATQMVDPALGYATGWNYFFKYAMATPTNLTAAGLIIQYWRPDLNVSIWITVFAFFIIAINLFNVSKLGETEFTLGFIKITVIFSLIITCFVISMGGAPNNDRVGFRYWREPGAFAQYLLTGNKGYLLGWWACMCQACFAYTGTEVVGMTFGEAKNPRKSIPRAIKQTFWRISLFYVVGVLVLGMAVPHDSADLVGATKASTSAAASPFVVAIELAGIKVLPDIINASLLVFVLSAASSDIYCASRTLTSLVTVFAVLNWLSILMSYFGFRRGMKAQNIARKELPFKDFLQPYGAIYAICLTGLVIIFQGYDAFVLGFQISTFFLKYVGIAVYVFNIVSWKLLKKTRFVTGLEMDLTTNRSKE